MRLEGKGQSGSHGSVWEVLSAMEVLLGGLEKAKNIYNARKHKHVAESINIGWKKLREYYIKLDSLPTYVAAVALNLSVKLRYFEIKWTIEELKDWVPTIKESI
jgi:hypothetical protein